MRIVSELRRNEPVDLGNCIVFIGKGLLLFALAAADAAVVVDSLTKLDEFIDDLDDDDD